MSVCETTKETNMTAMTQTLRKFHILPGSFAHKAPVRIHHVRGQELRPVAKVRDWNSMVPAADVGKLRYIAELNCGSAPVANVVLP